MMVKSVLVIICFFLLSIGNNEPKLLYNSPPLVLTENTLSDGLGAFSVEDLPVVNPKCNFSCKYCSIFNF